MNMAPEVSSRTSRYLGLAAAYERAATLLFENGGAAQSPAPYFHIVAHAFELCLKGVIARGHCDDEHLMALGHDLSFCLRLALDKGLSLGDSAPTVEGVVNALSHGHHGQSYRYPTLFRLAPPSAESALLALQVTLRAAAELSEARPK
ncbi:hypothetical protein [uncultured Phenylobacterium sp.]|uniref:hypothetical protein n=1 Tax=uncultured Phenylobacterium sp. TaxID=349273 RepID=UPI0025ED522C|nr:hypothetical protein [uncultured Phenylobacterium sp.]